MLISVGSDWTLSGLAAMLAFGRRPLTAKAAHRRVRLEPDPKRDRTRPALHACPGL